MSIHTAGYIVINSKLEHITIAEQALGKKLPRGALVHHADQNKQNNERSNLVICPNESYHKLLHLRLKALAASNNAENRKCVYCKIWDNPNNLIERFKDGGTEFRHAKCHSQYNSRNRARIHLGFTGGKK